VFTIFYFVGAILVALLIYLVGAAMVRNLANGEPPPEPEETELEDVDYRYQCIVCGAQLVLFAAPEGEVPAPPRHCREPMSLVSRID